MTAQTLAWFGVENDTTVVIVLDAGGGATPQQFTGQIIGFKVDNVGRPYAVHLRVKDQLAWYNYDRIIRWYEPPASQR